VVVAAAAVAASSMMARAESNDGMVRYDRGNDGRGCWNSPPRVHT
jgi:hypothetical protein